MSGTIWSATTFLWQAERMILCCVMKAIKAKGFDGIRILVSKTNYPAFALYEKNA
jgi:ribosomal protein S18 acetylase RimI-like enzyme